VKATVIILIILVPCFTNVAVSGKIDEALNTDMLKGMGYLYKDNFSKALKIFHRIKDKYSDHPVGYFLVAAALDAKMYFYHSSHFENEFIRHCEKAIEIGERLLQNRPDDVWVLFFVGGAYGYMGQYQARYKNYITSFRNGWIGVSLLKQIYKKDPGFVDVLLGLGTYNYWSSRLSKALWWMPGLSDKREVGINQLKKAIHQGKYTVYPAAGNLMWILIEEKRYQEAKAIAQRMLKQYPNNRLFSLGMARIHFDTEQYDAAEKQYRHIMDLCDSEAFNNNVISLGCRVFLAKIYEKKQIYYKAMAECRRARAYKFNETDTIVAKEYISEVNKMIRRIRKNYRIVR
jgi:tetratricopeptide (TPR) repeat protein